MKRALGLVLAGLASFAFLHDVSLASEPWRWSELVQPPTPRPNAEVGVRYWASEGRNKFSIDSTLVNPAFGSPTSVLDYDGVDARSAEFFFRVENEARLFFKGFVGAGTVDGGSLDDEDYLAGQIKFSDTLSKLDGDHLFYLTLDIGKSFHFTTARGKFSLSPLIGISYWRENMNAYGVQCNSDAVNGAFCGAPGQVVVPFSELAISNDQGWGSLRLGAEVRATFFDRLTLIADAALLPVAYLAADDSHHLRSDLGPVPNIRDEGSGIGFQFEASARFDVTPNLALGAGVRYWTAETDGQSEFSNIGAKVMLKDYESERFGVFGEALYQFSFQ